MLSHFICKIIIENEMLSMYRLYYNSIACVTGTAAKEAMMPYFPQVMDSLKQYLTVDQNTDTMCLQVQSVGKPTSCVSTAMILVLMYCTKAIFLK